LTDIITDKVNGFAIPNDDISLYIKQMKLLMTDEKLRKSMSANAIKDQAIKDIKDAKKNINVSFSHK
jgi:hypothetical protein